MRQDSLHVARNWLLSDITNLSKALTRMFWGTSGLVWPCGELLKEHVQMLIWSRCGIQSDDWDVIRFMTSPSTPG